MAYSVAIKDRALIACGQADLLRATAMFEAAL